MRKIMLKLIAAVAVMLAAASTQAADEIRVKATGTLEYVSFKNRPNDVIWYLISGDIKLRVDGWELPIKASGTRVTVEGNLGTSEKLKDRKDPTTKFYIRANDVRVVQAAEIAVESIGERGGGDE